MTIIEKNHVPIYEVICNECKSKIHYKKSEVSLCHITCPVCGMSLWAKTRIPVAYQMEVDDERTNDIPIFDEEEIYPNCTVQILRNSITGQISVGWWKNTEGEDK